MKLDKPAIIELHYSKEPPTTFDGIVEITEGADGSLKLKRPGEIIRILASYRYYILFPGGEDDGESEFSRPW